jgi:hypothetical protein
VRYWRTYIYKGKGLGGFYPLDIELGLPADGFSMLLRSHAAKLATKMSYAQSVGMLSLFIGWSPCQKTIEEMVLGFGRHTSAWFEYAPPPSDDGEILVIQIDGKATPTATVKELKKRRGKRRIKNYDYSYFLRHRQAHVPKKRKKKGDKSKNGRTATIVVMYTLKRNKHGVLEGPVNKKVYASYSKKRHAFAVARREADKRGFTKDSGKKIQVVTDGDNDLERHVKEFFPEAIHTIDVYHVTEYLWKAGGCLYKEGSDEIAEWVGLQKHRLYNSKINDVIDEIDKQIKKMSTIDSSLKNKEKTMKKVKKYLEKRIDKINYKDLLKQGLEISSGAVEGAVNYVIAKRFDCGGMRWIKERAEALLQLRCIEINGDWDSFIDYVHDRTTRQEYESSKNLFLKSTKPSELPNYGLN